MRQNLLNTRKLVSMVGMDGHLKCRVEKSVHKLGLAGEDVTPVVHAVNDGLTLAILLNKALH